MTVDRYVARGRQEVGLKLPLHPHHGSPRATEDLRDLGLRAPAVAAQLLLPGYSGELAFELGLIDTELDFPATQQRDLINERAVAAQGQDDFSDRIRATPERRWD